MTTSSGSRPCRRTAARSAASPPFSSYGAGDILEIAPEGGGEPLLLPFTKAVAPTIDFAAGRSWSSRPRRSRRAHEKSRAGLRASSPRRASALGQLKLPSKSDRQQHEESDQRHQAATP